MFVEDEKHDNLAAQRKDDTLLKFIKEFRARKQYFISFVQQHTNHSINIIFSAMNQFYDSSNKKTTHKKKQQQTNSSPATLAACRSILNFIIVVLLPYLTQIIWFTFAFIINSNL